MSEKKKGAVAIAQVAKINGVSEEYVRKEIQKEIIAAQMDKEIRNRWNEIFGANVVPTPEEFVMKMGQML